MDGKRAYVHSRSMREVGGRCGTRWVFGLRPEYSRDAEDGGRRPAVRTQTEFTSGIELSRRVSRCRARAVCHQPPPSSTPPLGSCYSPCLLATVDHNSNKHHGRTQEFAIREAFAPCGRRQSQEKSHAIPSCIPDGFSVHTLVGLQAGNERGSHSGEPR